MSCTLPHDYHYRYDNGIFGSPGFDSNWNH